jgi:hypothetical protein
MPGNYNPPKDFRPTVDVGSVVNSFTREKLQPIGALFGGGSINPDNGTWGFYLQVIYSW